MALNCHLYVSLFSEGGRDASSCIALPLMLSASFPSMGVAGTLKAATSSRMSSYLVQSNISPNKSCFGEVGARVKKLSERKGDTQLMYYERSTQRSQRETVNPTKV